MQAIQSPYRRWLYEYNEHSKLIDALSYIDPLSEEDSAKAKALIEKELFSMGLLQKGPDGTNFISKTTDDLVDKLYPQTLFFENNEIIQNQFKRIREKQEGKTTTSDQSNKGTKEEACLDLNRYSEIEPPANTKDLSAWEKSINHARTLIEYSSRASVNMELMLENCQNNWLKHLQGVGNIESSLKKETTQLQQESDQINKRRKLDQITCANELRSLEQRLADYRTRNTRIIGALGELEKETKELEEKAKNC